jgi:hypothetical protein
MHPGITHSNSARTVVGDHPLGYQPVRSVKPFVSGKHYIKVRVEGTLGRYFNMALGIANG